MDWITAAATLALAVAAGLAYRQNREIVSSNRELVETAREQSTLMRATLERQLAALLVPAGPHACREGDLIETEMGPSIHRMRRVFLGVENAGPGLARIVNAQASSHDRGVYSVWWPPAVPSGRSRELQLTPSAGVQLGLIAGETITVRVEYEGQDGERNELTFDAQHYPGGEWHLRAASVEA